MPGHHAADVHVKVREPTAEKKAPASTQSQTVTEADLQPGQILCLKCHSKVAEFETDPCSHMCFCKACAMKCASGGKCKVCNQMYGNLRRAH